MPEVLDSVVEPPAPLGGDPEGQRYRLFEAVAAFLAGSGRDAPLLLVLEDLQWADKPTLLLLKHLARAREHAGLLILGTYREMELGKTHPLAEVLGDLRRENLFDRLSLQGLDEADVRALMTSVAGHEVPLAFARAVHVETEGNPFFIGEILRHLAETGVAFGRGGRWTTDLTFDRIGIPEGVKQVTGRRLSRLSDVCHHLLRIAAVIGREFRMDVLESVSGLSSDQLVDALDEAVEVAVIAEMPHAVGRYSFVHTLIRETLHGELTTTRRVRWHGRIAQAIESACGGEVEAHLPQLAYHFIEAAPGGDVDKAIDYATRAGERSIRLLAYEEAVSHYERALEVLDLTLPEEDGRRCELLLALADALWSTGEATTARETFLRAAGIARRLGAPERLARAALGAGAAPRGFR